jgi:hypothetical protein
MCLFFNDFPKVVLMVLFFERFLILFCLFDVDYKLETSILN